MDIQESTSRNPFYCFCCCKTKEQADGASHQDSINAEVVDTEPKEEQSPYRKFVCRVNNTDLPKKSLLLDLTDHDDPNIVLQMLRLMLNEIGISCNDQNLYQIFLVIANIKELLKKRVDFIAYTISDDPKNRLIVYYGPHKKDSTPITLDYYDPLNTTVFLHRVHQSSDFKKPASKTPNHDEAYYYELDLDIILEKP